MTEGVRPIVSPSRLCRRVTAAVLAAIMAWCLSGCGGSSARPKSSAPRTTPVTALRSDTWTPPAVPGPASTAKFCTLLVAQYQHIKTNDIAVNLRLRQQIIGDYIRFTPTVVAAAPPQIASAASTYLQDTAKVLGLLSSAGLNAAKTPPGSIGAVLLDPGYRAASASVFAFSQSYCHYDITSVG